jgi:hypothetical protein
VLVRAALDCGLRLVSALKFRSRNTIGGDWSPRAGETSIGHVDAGCGKDRLRGNDGFGTRSEGCRKVHLAFGGRRRT